ncbi:MAG: hypothetical protein NVS3B29_07540 [Candidatus Saccharimonadales bacterium]
MLMLERVKHFRLLITAAAIMLPAAASANLLQSSHFRLDPNVASSFGGSGSSASYKLTDAGGEAAVGAGSSQSYKLTSGYVASLPHSMQLSVLPNATYAYWPFDTGSGTRGYDVGMNSDNATLVNAPAWTAGIVGQAVTLNGSTQYVSTSNQVSGPSAFTIEIWFKSTSTTGGRLMGFGDTQTGASTNHDRQLYLDNAGHVIFGVKPAATYQTVATTATYTDGSWHHAVGTLGSAGLLLYIDGINRGTDATTTTAGIYSGYWKMGFDDLTGWPAAPTSNYVAASIDEARVLTRQLSAAEVTNDYTAGANALHGAFTLPNVSPGISQTYSADAVVRTDAGGYDLYIQAPGLLKHTDNVTTIPMISANIATPAAWAEGTTKGLGFTLTAGTGLEAAWGTSPNYNYAGIPSSATVFHSRTGLNGGIPELTTLQFRADTAASQKSGTYSTTIIYTATVRP